MNWPTIIIASLVAIVFLAIVVAEVRKRKSGKGACSCGGSCGEKGEHTDNPENNQGIDGLCHIRCRT